GPRDQVAEAAVEVDLRHPAEVAPGLFDVADVEGLVALAPIGELELGFLARQLADLIDDLQQVALVLGPTADVIDLAAGDPDLVDDDCVQRAEVACVQQVANLGAVSIDGQSSV